MQFAVSSNPLERGNLNVTRDVQSQRQKDANAELAQCTRSDIQSRLSKLSKTTGTGGIAKPKARRSGPLTIDSRQQMKRLRAIGGSCWRCKVLRKQADQLTISPGICIPVTEFLAQFQSPTKGMAKFFEESTLEIFEEMATLQISLEDRHRDTDVEMSGNDLIVAALRAFVLTYELSIMDIKMPYRCEGEEVELETSRYDLQMTVKKRMITPAAVDEESETRPGNKLERTLQSLLRLTQQTLFRRRPRDQPMLLCTLCVLTMIVRNFTVVTFTSHAIDQTANVLEGAVSSLCRLYEICAKGVHPLSNDWKIDHFAASVGNDAALVRCFKKLNEIWITCG
ncbi:uncharacterized protein KY384_005714 [Bacidia gigantensis]|uniref:uncharacterized protein n=1 Tax=Bacidia gigantensis TaxID=2732470 RepID=UPI001D046460|nr:uncharacterized protein KY384_005714 [Bacidia gigantensis]KAG8529079.1 hypothetical protein KY384_005714 [Bacidia gigantensis]